MNPSAANGIAGLSASPDRKEEGDLISVLVPCYNEEAYIASCLDSIFEFKLPPGTAVEILVIDGGSTDQSLRIVGEIADGQPRVRLLHNPRRIQAAALNIGIAAARGSWIMRLDAHCIYPANYLELCLQTALRTGAANVGGLCITKPGGSSYQAQLVQALTTHKFGVGNSGFRTGAAEGPRDTVPFGFFPRALFATIGFFDERLIRAQDYEFNRRIGASGRQVWLNPAIQSHYFNQPTLRAFYRKQFYQEAPYNVYLWYLAPYAFTPRHAITGVFALGLIGGLILSLFAPWVAWSLAAVMTLYALIAAASAVQQALRYRRLWHLICLPPCFFLFHLVHGLGLLAGVCRLALGNSPVQRAGEPWPGAARIRTWPLPSAKLPRQPN